jgi:transposase
MKLTSLVTSVALLGLVTVGNVAPTHYMDFHLDNLLNLPNVIADSYSSTLDAIVVKLQLVNAGINCPNCNEYVSQVHQTHSVLVRDLSIFGRVVYLKVPRRQFYCPICKKSPTEPLLWVNKKQRQTNRYQEYISY